MVKGESVFFLEAVQFLFVFGVIYLSLINHKFFVPRKFPLFPHVLGKSSSDTLSNIASLFSPFSSQQGKPSIFSGFGGFGAASKGKQEEEGKKSSVGAFDFLKKPEAEKKEPAAGEIFLFLQIWTLAAAWGSNQLPLGQKSK